MRTPSGPGQQQPAALSPLAALSPTMGQPTMAPAPVGVPAPAPAPAPVGVAAPAPAPMRKVEQKPRVLGGAEMHSIPLGGKILVQCVSFDLNCFVVVFNIFGDIAIGFDRFCVFNPFDVV